MAFLRFDQVSFAYPDAKRRALDRISFSMEEGEYVAVCGQSGCGKTTLLRQAKPELVPAGAKEGQIFYQGIPLSELDRETSAMRIGFVQQNPDNQIVTDLVWHELAFGLENMALPTPVIRRRVSEMASFFGMEGWFRQKTEGLSGGQKQMLNLASIMVMDPKLLILDEPASMLDPLAARNLLQMVHRINRELGVAVLLCEHRLEEVFQAADRVLLLEKGRILADHTPAALAQSLRKNPESSRIYYGLPGAVRIFGELEQKGLYPEDRELPLSIRDARRELKKAVPEAYEKTADGVSACFCPSGGRRKKEAPVLVGSELWFRYEEKGKDILRGLDMELYRGEILALMGGNGTGKSTLLKILSGIQKPLRGRVKPAGGVRTAMLPQSPQALFIHDTLLEDLTDSASGDVRKAMAVADRLELSEKITSHPYDLSGGEMQRAAIGKLFLQEADIMLLDEPTKGLDAYLKRELAMLLRRLAAEGTAFLIVTHDLEYAASYTDRCALLFDGRITSSDEPHAFFAGNRFYTTAAGLIAGDVFQGAITCEEVVKACVSVKKAGKRAAG